MTVATLQDVANTLQRYLDDDEANYTQPMLDYIEAIIQSRVTRALEWAAQSEPYRIILARIEAEAVCRVLRAPAGGVLKYETEGDYTYSVNNAVASGRLEITPDEWKALTFGAAGWGSNTTTMDGYVRNKHAHTSNPNANRPPHLHPTLGIPTTGTVNLYDQDIL